MTPSVHPPRDEEPRGTTLKVYWFVMKAGGPVRVSEVQSGVGLSSASLALYHLRKLVDMGLIREEQSGYVIEKFVVHSFFRIRKTLVPFQVAYVVFFACTLVVLFVALKLEQPLYLTSFDFISLVAVIAALVISIYEMIRTMKTMP